MPSVTPIPNERLCFMVTSESGKKPYRVDLEEDGGKGGCECGDFCMRILKNRRDKKGRQWCKHILKAYGYFGWQMAVEIARQTKRK